ncbi:PQQ-binding-like beta-propeller repeat protein [Streptomyces sp. NPDC051909]|uniref:outer membrane protein assembly factor BamB family protein n=1 Tax=Streptomyces sp. NPDC051909 TaxID=3154944 RepID=UPI003444FDEF
MTAFELGTAGRRELWRTPFGSEFDPRQALVEVDSDGAERSTVHLVAHWRGNAPRSEYRVVSSSGREILRCRWRPYDRQEHVELSHDGVTLIATRTALKPRLSGLSTPKDRIVEIRSTHTGKILASQRSTDFAQDRGRVYLRQGSDVSALDSRTGRLVWRVATGVRLGDPRRGSTSPLFAVAGHVFVHSEEDHAVVALRAADGRVLWRASVGPVSSVRPVGQDRFLIQHAEGFTFVSPQGSERNVPFASRSASAGLSLEDLVTTSDGPVATAVESKGSGASALVVFGAEGRWEHGRLEIPLPSGHVQAALADSVVYVLPWVPDGERAVLHAYDLRSGHQLWSVGVPDRLTIPSTPGGPNSLHAVDHGLIGLDRAAGWVAGSR